MAPYAWAQQVNPQELQQVFDLARRSTTDPIGYMQEYIAELQQHPQYAQQLRSLAAKALAQHSRQPQVPTEPQPDVPIQFEDGRVVHLYSAEQQAKREAFLRQQWLDQVKEEFAPVKQSHEQLQAERAHYAQQREIANYVDTTYQDVQTWPGMSDEANRIAVAKELAKVPIAGDDPREVSLALNAAYRKVVLPLLSQNAQAKLLDNLQQKASASTSVNPGSAAPSSPRQYKSFHDLPADAWR